MYSKSSVLRTLDRRQVKMEFTELIKARRSVRNYQEGVVIPEEDIREIVEAAELAPSWKNSQTARYYVANNPESIARLAATLPAFNQASSAGAALIVTTFVKDTSGFTAGSAENELSNKWGAYDLGLSNAYFILAAKEHGYDTLIMGLRDAAAIRQEFGIPKTEQITSVIALGKGTSEGSLKPRKEVDEVLKFL